MDSYIQLISVIIMAATLFYSVLEAGKRSKEQHERDLSARQYQFKMAKLNEYINLVEPNFKEFKRSALKCSFAIANSKLDPNLPSNIEIQKIIENEREKADISSTTLNYYFEREIGEESDKYSSKFGYILSKLIDVSRLEYKIPSIKNFDVNMLGDTTASDKKMYNNLSNEEKWQITFILDINNKLKELEKLIPTDYFIKYIKFNIHD